MASVETGTRGEACTCRVRVQRKEQGRRKVQLWLETSDQVFEPCGAAKQQAEWRYVHILFVGREYPKAVGSL